MFSYQNI